MPPPKLLFFAPCEKVIVDAENNATSLIAILESLTLNVKESEKIPDDAKVPLNWCVIALWQQVEPNEKWEQRLLMDMPDGLDLTMKIDFAGAKVNWRNVVNIKGFPLGQALKRDHILLKLYARLIGSVEWQYIAEYPLLLRREAVKDETKTA
jgi:hypothetical protein